MRYAAISGAFRLSLPPSFGRSGGFIDAPLPTAALIIGAVLGSPLWAVLVNWKLPHIFRYAISCPESCPSLH